MPAPLRLVLASGNLHKRDEIAARLGARRAPVELVLLQDPPSPEETGSTFAANALIKAFAWHARAEDAPCLADDSGLVVAALDGAPGVFSSRFAERADRGQSLPKDLANNLELLRRLDGERDRRAAFHCALALVASSHTAFGRWLLDVDLPAELWRMIDAGRVCISCDGATTGEILDVPAEHDGTRLTSVLGGGGFGYDPLFLSDDLDCTFADASAAEKNEVSHRGRALDRLAVLLEAWAETAP